MLLPSFNTTAALKTFVGEENPLPKPLWHTEEETCSINGSPRKYHGSQGTAEPAFSSRTKPEKYPTH